VLVEAESAKVGDLRLPPHLWAAMGKAPRICIAAPLAERAKYLTRAYADIVADGARLAQVIDLLRHAHARETIEGWMALAQAGDFAALALDLMRVHYDPRYEKHRARMETISRTIAAPSLDAAALEGLAAKVRDALAEIVAQDGQIAHPTNQT
jgi:tRNA 2-selenouridine synthase